MSEFLDRISRLSPQRLALLADELNRRLQAAEGRRQVPLAIVGIGCRLPGGVQNPEQFWTLLSEGVNAVGEVPPSRWNIAEHYDSNPDTPGKMSTRWGGFIEDHDQFDPKFFGIAPAEAASMDPQQRLLLETSWEALEHAGIAPARLSGTQTAVFIGICNGDYSQVALNAPREAITPYFAPGLSHAVAAGRISYVLGLQGPSMAIDTSCSASLVAVHMACQSLRSGESEMALAGGVNLVFNPEITIALSQSKMMAPDGRCKAFSDSANGFVRGEGCGIVVLKRLPDAVRDRNRILAVIRGSACNQDGRSSGLTAPNGPSQEAVIASALSDAGLRPNDIDVIEAHGTGTALGDPIEAGALNAVFAGRTSSADPLFVGSVKTNLGHLESAAGIAGLIKLVLSIQHGQIPASLHFDKPNSRIEWDRLPIKIPTKLQPWERRGDKRNKNRVGGISSFGFSGTNAHVIIEEYPEDASASTTEDRPLLFTLSARNPTALAAIAARLHRHLIAHPSLPLRDAAHTLNAGRSHFEHRAALTAASHRELLEQLSRLHPDENASNVHSGRAAAHAPRVAFVFGDDSPERRFSARELYENAPAFRESVQRCQGILKDELALSIDLASHFSAGVDSPKKAQEDAEQRLHWKIANCVEQYALATLWQACGIQPAAVLGCGSGQYIAAFVAGALSLTDVLRGLVADGRGNSTQLNQHLQTDSHQETSIPLICASAGNLAISALAKEGCAANLFMGDVPALQQFVNGLGEDLPGTWLATLESQYDCREFLNTAASLYVLGCDLKVDAFYRETPKTVSLPTYPFERERYWLEWKTDRRDGRESGASTERGGLPSDTTDALQAGRNIPEEDGWIYDLTWEPKPLPPKISPNTTAILDQEMLRRIAVTPATPELTRVDRLTAAAMPVYATVILEAFQQAGLSWLPKDAFTLEEFAQRLKIAPSRRRILGRLLDILVEDKIAECIEKRFRFIDFQPRPDAELEIERLRAEYPECRTEMNILLRCAKKLMPVLQGAYDPMQLVFADGSVDEAEQIYRDSPICRFFNEKTSAIACSAADRIQDRPVRILEIGGGTGATTVPILSGLAGTKTEIDYTFTDVSPVFLSRARIKFSEAAFMSYRVLDIENDPQPQGFARGEYDIVIAANVLHATADLRRTIAHVRSLLAPGGVLLLLEGTRPDRWLDLTFGLTDGWWRFVDLDLRPHHPLLSADTWAALLEQVGISFCHTVSYASENGTLSQQVVIVAQVDPELVQLPEDPPQRHRDWIVFADTFGVGDALHTLLTQAGQKCEIVRRPASESEFWALFHRLQTRQGIAAPEIVYLWGIDAGEPDAFTTPLSSDAELSGKTLIHLIQSVLARRDRAGRLWIATRGAQATGTFSPDARGTVQSIAWGIGRVLSAEAPDRIGALIDLDPALEPKAAAVALLTELLAGDTEDQIAYRDGQRLIARLRRSRLQDSTADSPQFRGFRADRSYLLVGGLGGIGLRVARWAAEHNAGHIVLLGRTGTGMSAGTFAEERLRAIKAIQNLGAKITVVEADMASEADMAALFQRFGTDLPPLGGAFHLATDTGGAAIGELTDHQIDSMLRSKVAGTWLLHHFTKKLPLDFFVAFSSTTSVLGATGMAHYSAANQFVDSFAHHRRASGLPMISVNWGAWDVMRLVSQESQDNLKRTGILPMPSEKLLDLLGKLTVSHRAQVMIADIDWGILKRLFEVRRSRPLLENIGNPHPKPGNAASPVPAHASLHAARELASHERSKYVESFVVEQASRVLGFRPGEALPLEVPLTDIGLDSLMAVDLKNRLQIALGQELSPTVVFDYPTVTELVGMLETVLWAGHASAEDRLALSHQDEICI